MIMTTKTQLQTKIQELESELQELESELQEFKQQLNNYKELTSKIDFYSGLSFLDLEFCGEFPSQNG